MSGVGAPASGSGIVVEHGEVRSKEIGLQFIHRVQILFGSRLCAHHSSLYLQARYRCLLQSQSAIVHVLSTDYSAHSSASLTGSQLPLASFTGSQLPPLASQTTLVTSLAGV